MQVPFNRTLAAIVVATVLALALLVPIIGFFVSHPLPAGTNTVMVLIPNLILVAGVWVASFFGARAVIRN